MKRTMTMMVAALAACWPPPTNGGTAACTSALDTTAEIQDAMRNAAPGAILLIAPGVYVGNTSTSGDPGSKGLFYSGRSGTASSPIILMSCDPERPAVLTGVAINDGSYGLHLTGDHWQIHDLVVTRAQKGIVIDNGNHNLLSGLEVHLIGDEGVHFRDGSSYNTLEHSEIRDTGNYQAGFGEGAYVGSDAGASYEHAVIGNVIRHTDFAGDITAEHIDIKEGADGTVVEYCTFIGTGISGSNSADSFVDVKGVNSVIRYNQGNRNGNGAVADAFQVRTHGTGYATGENNRFHNNTVDLDSSPGYVVYATSATTGTTAYGDVRIGGGHLYSGNVGTPVVVGVDPPRLAAATVVGFAPNPSPRPPSVAFVLRGSGPARLEIADVAGRSVFATDVGSLGAGRHVLRLDALAHTPPGIYLISLSQAGERRAVRGAIVR